MKDRVAMRSKLEGFKLSRLPEFTKEEITLIKGTHDYLAVNHYSTSMINATKEGAIGKPSFAKDISTLEWKRTEWAHANSGWFTVSTSYLAIVIIWNNFLDCSMGFEKSLSLA